MKKFLSLLSAIVAVNLVSAQNFEQRKQQYIDSVVANDYEDAVMIQAYLDDPVNQDYLDAIYSQFGSRSTIDFKLVELVRVMFLTDGSYDQQILDQMETLPYWINDGDTLHNFWTENHMIMWMSCEWLLHERFGIEVDDNLEQRLLHYLNLKLDVGFYEFFSSTYFPYTVSGLMNLADFAEDPEIRDKAEAVVRKLFKDVLMMCNSEGVFYPAAGRNYVSRYMNVYGQNHNAIVYLAGGLGPAPSLHSERASFIATSNIDFSDIENEFSSELDTVYSFGYSPEEALIKHDSLYSVDELIIQWSSGMYFHPYLAENTAQLLADSSFWGHVDFTDFNIISGLPVSQASTIATELDELTVSRTDCGADVAIYKNDEIVLTSIQDYWKGKIGFQQWPIAANVGGTAVFTASGEVNSDWTARNNSNFNEHLPYIAQDENVALIMYRPQEVSPILPFENKDVALFWVDSAFDSVDEVGNWLFGNRDENYVAVRRACVGEINGVRACETNAGQTWVMIVGNDQLYNSYADFQDLVTQSTFNEEWISSSSEDSTYYASIEFNGSSIEHYWGPSEPFTGIDETENNESFKVYPNPSSGAVNLRFSSAIKSSISAQIYSTSGQLMCSQSFNNSEIARINVSGFSKGVYFIKIIAENRSWTEKFIKH